MVFVTMSNDDSPYFVPVFNQVTHVRDDEADAEHIVIREGQTGIDDDDISFPYWITVIFLPISPKPPKGITMSFFFFSQNIPPKNKYSCSPFQPRPPIGASGLSYMKIKRTVVEIIPSIIFSVISGTLSTI